MDAEWLRSRWAQLCRPGHYSWTWDMLVSLYSTYGRHYHTLEHVENCIELVSTIRHPNVDHDAAQMALFWHDAVYVVGSEHNEWQSALLVDAILPSVTVKRGVLVRQAILGTASHDILRNVAEVGGATIAAVCDVDMAILGTEPDVYRSYVSLVRKEYGRVGDDRWREGRSAFLRGFLEKDRIFSLPEMADRFEAKARQNMRSELEAA